MTGTTSQEKDQQNKASYLTQLIEHPRLWALPSGQQGAPFLLTAPELGASVLTVTDEGHIYLSLGKDVDEADSKSLKGVYRLSEHGELELVFTHPSGVNALTVRQCGEITRYIYSAKAHCGSLEELKTICCCGRKALFNGRTVDGRFVFDGDQVAIDGVTVGYESLCPACYLEESGGKLYQ